MVKNIGIRMKIEGKNNISATMIADSITKSGKRITTMELNFHRFILPEFNTHRMFSRNASSSRAIPVKKMLEQVRNNPAIPIEFGKNKSGMQSDGEHNEPIFYENDEGRGFKFEDDDRLKESAAEGFWQFVADGVVKYSEALSKAGYHKQVSNRLTEFAQFSKVIVTSTEWDNFFELRLHPAAQPEIQELARCMKECMDSSVPDILAKGDWHLPYITDDDYKDIDVSNVEPQKLERFLLDFYQKLRKLSVARCARVSYNNHDNSEPDEEKDIKLFDMLLEMGHMSPFEHQATPMPEAPFMIERVPEYMKTSGITHMDSEFNFWSGNFQDWIQFRQTI